MPGRINTNERNVMNTPPRIGISDIYTGSIGMADTILLTHSTFQKEFLFNYIKFISFQGGLT
jgi:hypothetical protein